MWLQNRDLGQTADFSLCFDLPKCHFSVQFVEPQPCLVVFLSHSAQDLTDGASAEQKMVGSILSRATRRCVKHSFCSQNGCVKRVLKCVPSIFVGGPLTPRPTAFVPNMLLETVDRDPSASI